MNFSIQYTSRAENDILRNADWWAKHHSLEQALRWEAAVKGQIQSLTSMPERHALSLENPLCPFDVRQKMVGLGPRPSYRALFIIKDSTVMIITIRRTSEDELALLNTL